MISFICIYYQSSFQLGNCCKRLNWAELLPSQTVTLSYLELICLCLLIWNSFAMSYSKEKLFRKPGEALRKLKQCISFSFKLLCLFHTYKHINCEVHKNYINFEVKKNNINPTAIDALILMCNIKSLRCVTANNHFCAVKTEFSADITVSQMILQKSLAYLMPIRCSRNMSYYYQCWKHLCCLKFLWKTWYFFSGAFE